MLCVRMEDFHGGTIRIEDFDDQRVAECDLFVIILGHVHGTCPDGSEKSYAELEYDKAVDLTKPILLFPAPEDFPLPASMIEDDAKRKRQREFRQHAVRGVIRNTFNSAEDLATQVVQSIRNWERSPRQPGMPATFLPLPPQPYFAHPYPLQDNFTGRQQERRMLTLEARANSAATALAAPPEGARGPSETEWRPATVTKPARSTYPRRAAPIEPNRHPNAADSATAPAHSLSYRKAGVLKHETKEKRAREKKLTKKI